MLGMELMANGRTAEAQGEFASAVHYRPDFAPAHLYLGSALAAQNQPDQALAEFRTVLQLDPTNSSARQQIESIQTTPRRNP
jgi:cytochrome c-type biogenesis protein CcmH/NrfG